MVIFLLADNSISALPIYLDVHPAHLFQVDL
jgi:hypothetical protein